MKSATPKLNCLIAALGALCLLANSAVAATMAIGEGVKISELINNNGTIVAGDKEFSNFEYTEVSVNDNEMPVAEAVKITPIIDDEGNYGLRIDGGFGDSVSTLGPSNATITFDVTVLDPTMSITGVTLSGDPVVLGDDGNISVLETFQPADTLGEYDASIFDDAASGLARRIDTVWFNEATPITTMRVRKDILANARPGNAPVAITTIDQIFYQTAVPEPSSAIMLLSVMGAAIAGVRYRLG